MSSYEDLYELFLSPSQWSNLEKIANFLEPFKDLTLKMSSSSQSTAYLIIPLFNIIIDHVEDTASVRRDDAISSIIEVAKITRTKLVRYYLKTNTTTMLCTALDPRRKFNYFLKCGFAEDEIVATKAL